MLSICFSFRSASNRARSVSRRLMCLSTCRTRKGFIALSLRFNLPSFSSYQVTKPLVITKKQTFVKRDTNHFIGLHSQLHLVISKLLAFTVRLLDLPQDGEFLLRGKSPGVGCVLFSQRVDLSFQILKQGKKKGA